MNAPFRTDGKTMTHSAFSRSSCGMLSGTPITSFMTVPEFSKRFCSLFAAKRELAANMMHAPKANLRNITTLHILTLVDEPRFVLDYEPTAPPYPFLFTPG